MRAGIYARISDDSERTQLGVTRQVEDCETLAHARVWDIVDRYVDNDISAYTGKRRPEYRRMLADITAGRLDAIIVYHQDRLHRQPRELEEFFDVCDRAGVTNMATVSGDIDLATDDGRFHARIMGAVARKSSDDQSRRLKRKALELARDGRPAGGGDRPFGYEPDRVTVRPDEAAVIRELADRALAGESLRSLCLDLDRRQIRSGRGGVWQSTPLRRMLMSARLSGQREHHGEIVGPAVWPGILTPEQTASLRALYSDPGRRAVRPARSYLLKGLLRCWNCEAVLVARPREDGRRRYVCATGIGYLGCGRCYVLADPVEVFVTELGLTWFDSPQAITAVNGARVARSDDWQTRTDRLAGKLDELAVLWAADKLTMREWLAAREPLEAQIAEARRRIDRSAALTIVAEHAGRGAELRRRWPDMGVDRQRAVIAAVLFHVTVGPGRRGFNRFDAGRFDPAWRH